MTQPPQPSPPTDSIVRPARRRSALPWLLALVGTLALLCCGGGTAAALILKDEAPRQVSADPTASPDATSPAGSAPPAGPPPRPGSTPTPAGSDDPQGQATDAGTPSPTGAADVNYTGRGDRTIALSLSNGLRHTATITHRGRSNFVVWGLDEAGDENGLVVNEVGRYSGIRPLDFDLVPAALRVEADGAWSITVRAFTKIPLWDGGASGSDPTVLRLDPTAGAAVRVRVTHTGASNVSVTAYAQHTRTLFLQSLLVNEIGRYSGEISLPPGTVAVAIDTVGPWTFRRS